MDYLKSKAIGIWYVKLNQQELKKVTFYLNLGCLDEFEKLMGKYGKLDARKIDLKSLEKDIAEKIKQVLKYYEKNAIGNKEEKRRQIK